MKSQRRHELEKNELADWLAAVIVKTRPYQNAVLGVVLLALVTWLGYNWWTNSTAGRQTQAWNDLFEAMDSGNPAKLDEIVEQYPGSRAAHTAAVISGDLHLGYGCNMRFVNKVSANQELRQAIEFYLGVLEQSGVADLRERATFGLGRARETIGDLNPAMQHYEDVTKNWPDGAFAAAAAERLADLKRPATKKFYDRLAKFDPKPAFSSEPSLPDKPLPFDLNALPEAPSVKPESIFPLELRETGPEEKQPADTPAEPTAPNGPSEPE